jgi:hypothetical protein
MEISAQRGFWILEYYRRHGMILQFGGKILGEEAACSAVVTRVSSMSNSIAIGLLSDDDDQIWENLILLDGGTFCFDQLGDDSFERENWAPSHSVLRVGFADGTILVFAEIGAGRGF